MDSSKSSPQCSRRQMVVMGSSPRICFILSYHSFCILYSGVLYCEKKGGWALVYEIIRSRRRTVALEVTREGRVLIRAPLRMPQSEIEQFAASHAAWLEKAQDRVAARQAAHPPLTEQERDALRRRAETVLPGKVAHYAALMGVVPASVKITAARTRFGSCSGKNSLCFSLHLMRYPEAAIDYVVVHELAHIRHKNHGPDFYALVRGTLPDYDARIKLLK